MCLHFGLEPFRTLSSGALLVCVSPEDVASLLKAYQAAGIKAAHVGTMVSEELTLLRKGLKYPLIYDGQDEISKILE